MLKVKVAVVLVLLVACAPDPIDEPSSIQQNQDDHNPIDCPGGIPTGGGWVRYFATLTIPPRAGHTAAECTFTACGQSSGTCTAACTTARSTALSIGRNSDPAQTHCAWNNPPQAAVCSLYCLGGTCQ